MSRTLFAAEIGYRITGLDVDSGVDILFGSGAPGGDTSYQDDAPIGSLYQRTDGSLYIKVADTNATSDWQIFAAVLSGSYSPVNGDPTIGDSFEEAIEKLDGNQDDIQTTLGVAQGAVDLGTFTGVTIPDSQTIKQALQALETAHEEVDQNVNDLITLSGVAENVANLGTFTGAIIPDSSTIKAALQSIETFIEDLEPGKAVEVTGLTTLATVDSLLVDNIHMAEWEIVAFEEATPANKQFMKVSALHNGTAAADATVVDDSVHTKLKTGANFNLVISVDLNGIAGAQVMRLRASSSTTGVTIQARRTVVLESL